MDSHEKPVDRGTMRQEHQQLDARANRSALPGLASAARLLVALAAVFAQSPTAVAQAQATSPPPSSAREGMQRQLWLDDLEFLAANVRKIHPGFNNSPHRDKFEQLVQDARNNSGDWDAPRWTAGLMKVAASMEDGHTALWPTQKSFGNDRILPIVLAQLEGSLYVTAASQDHADLLGEQVTEVGGKSAVDLFHAATELVGADNRFAREWNAPKVLMSPLLLRALGANMLERNIEIRVGKDASSRRITIQFKQFDPARFDLPVEWMLRSEKYVHLEDKDASHVPLYLQQRLAFYWMKPLPETGAVYVQINHLRDMPGDPFIDFCGRLWQQFDTDAFGSLVLDLRFNFGGNGQLVKTLVRGIAKRDKINQRGKLFVIIGPETYSAAMDLVVALAEYTNPVFVGQPSGAGLNGYGDPTELELPHSRFGVSISAMQHTSSHPYDSDPWVAPDLPAPLTVKRVRSNVDPAMDIIRGTTDFRSLTERALDGLKQGGIESMLGAYESFRHNDPSGWRNTEPEMNSLGYILLRAGKTDAAIAIFQANAAAYPTNWAVWDSLAEAHMKAGNNSKAIELYEKSLELNPENGNGRMMLQHLKSAAK